MSTTHLTRAVKITEAITEAQGAAGQTNINGAVIDMSGFEAVAMVITFGTIDAGAVTTVKAQRDVAAAFGGAADITGSGQTVADTEDGNTFVIDVYRPAEQFVRCVVTRGTANATVRSAFYIQYASRAIPVGAQGATIKLERHVDATEGAA